jgi:hypothetical protein
MVAGRWWSADSGSPVVMSVGGTSARATPGCGDPIWGQRGRGAHWKRAPMVAHLGGGEDGDSCVDRRS